MHKISIIIACLACIAHSRRAQTSRGSWESIQQVESRKTFPNSLSSAGSHQSSERASPESTANRLQVLSNLLQTPSPAAAFNPYGVPLSVGGRNSQHDATTRVAPASTSMILLGTRRKIVRKDLVEALLSVDRKDDQARASAMALLRAGAATDTTNFNSAIEACEKAGVFTAKQARRLKNFRKDKRTNPRTAILLLNLGGPERLSDVRPFLYNLFSDPDILRLPIPFLQKPLAWLISTLRAPKSQEAYKSIGGGSPLRRITNQQSQKLQRELRRRGINAKTYVAMRYWHPFTESALADLKADGVEQVVVLPLYPHFSISTSGSSFRELLRLKKADPVLQQLSFRCVRSWYDHPGYVKAMAEMIAKEIRASDVPTEAHVFFSAHGVPKSYVEDAGDPYQREIEACTALIVKEVQRIMGHSNPHTLAYQSRVGPVEWLKPYTEEALEELGRAGTRDLVVVPISFVSEHIETLEEMDIEYRELATEAGVVNFRRVPALDINPAFITSLTDLVVRSLQTSEVSLEEVAREPGKVSQPEENSEAELELA